MEERQYFILRGKDKDGPYTLETLKQIGIDGHTKIWYAGLSKWTRASDIPELSHALSLPPNASSGSKLVLPGLAIVLLVAGGLTGYKLLSKPKAIVMSESVGLSNQQLYKIYAPAVVLIQQRFMYEISAGEKRFYFNDYYSYDGDMGYLVGLTEDSAQAADQADPLQGTGFFIDDHGKILTNRHVAKPAPSEDEQYAIQRYFFQSLNGSLASLNIFDSVKRQKSENDSLLAALLRDSTANAAQVANVRQKISDAEEIIAEEGDNEEAPMKIDSATIDYLKDQTITIRKITLELRAFLPGTMSTEKGNGIECKVIATSEDENVDLALLQTRDKALPDTSVKVVNLSRIKHCDDDNMLAQMSERLILIGYNRGTDLAQTTEGIEAQLTDGKVSQNTDAFRLMYTIPTLPGSSGSPVLDDRGRLVSVNFAGMTETQGFNYGIQPKQIKTFLVANHIL